MNGSDYESSGNGQRKVLSAHLRQKADSVLAYAEGALPPREAQSLAAHMNSCPECREFALRARQIDLALEQALGPREVSFGFSARLAQRIEQECSLDAQTNYARRKRQMETEFQAYSNSMRKGLFGLRNVLDTAGYAVACAMAVYFLVTWLSALAGMWLPGFEEQRGLVLSCVTGLAFLLVGLATVLRTRLAH